MTTSCFKALTIYIRFGNFDFNTYFVPLPFPLISTTPFFIISFSSSVVFDFPKGTYGAISLIGFNIVLLRTSYILLLKGPDHMHLQNPSHTSSHLSAEWLYHILFQNLLIPLYVLLQKLPHDHSANHRLDITSSFSALLI